MRRLLHGSFLLLLLASTGTARAGESKTILDTRSFWRARTVRETEEAILPDGKIGYYRAKYDRNWFREHKGKTRVAEGDYKIVEREGVRLPETTSAEWMTPGFDDSAWVRGRGPIFTGQKWGVPMESRDANWKLILMRGRFKVTDPKNVDHLTLSLDFRGGAVVYMNGKQVTRASMPDGKISTTTPGLPYPDDVFFNDKGYLIWRPDDGTLWKKTVLKRIRHIKALKIPGSALRKGVNVIAVSLHRSPTPIERWFTRVKKYPMPDKRAFWCKVGLVDVELTAPAGAPVVPNRSAPKNRSFQVWNHSIVRKVFLSDYPDPFALLRPVRMTGVRNGIFAGQVVVGDGKPIKGLKAVASELKGPAVIPSSAVTLRYGRLMRGSRGSRGSSHAAFDALEDFPPKTVPVYEEHGGSCQPIWINAAVPADAKPGDYEGAVTISADGVEPVEVPVKVRVIDWTLPDANEFVARMDVAQSPESLAMAYDVELWSDEHLKLLDRTFSLLKPLAVKTLFVTAIRRTHWGNEHAMVRWVREDGELRPDFTVVEKYLDVATKHLGKVPGVILYCWEPLASMGHAGGAGSARRTKDKPIMYTLWDKKRDKLKKRKGPAWGTPEAKAFWKKFNEGIYPILKKRGLERSALYGLIGDVRPTKQAMDDITTGVEDSKWACHSHYYATSWQGYPLGMAIALWGIGCSPVDPSRGYGYGWRNPFWIAYYPREMSIHSTLVEHRIK
ncbi:MAG: glycoside hydrolase domain-containing protein, partial [Planctomycetota bacterium]